MKVFVYFNLHRKVWSVKALEGPSKGRVIQHLPEVLLADATAKVSAAGRARVLREKRKNVHAGIVGTLVPIEDSHSRLRAELVESFGDRITYNPYKYETFVHTVDEAPFEGSAYALLTADRAVFAA